MIISRIEAKSLVERELARIEGMTSGVEEGNYHYCVMIYNNWGTYHCEAMAKDGLDKFFHEASQKGFKEMHAQQGWSYVETSTEDTF